MKLRIHLLLLAIPILLIPELAFAQSGAALAPLANLSPTTLIIAGLGFLLAILTNLVNSGGIAGIMTPKAWLPYLTVALTFLAAFVTALTSSQPLTTLSWVNALIAGVTALIAYGGGHAVQVHVQTAVRMARNFKAGVAAKVLLPMALVLGLGAVSGPMLTGCSSLAQVVSVAEDYLTYANTFVDIAKGIWSVISPLLGSNKADADAQFQKVVNDFYAASAALGEGIAAYKSGTGPTPNIQAMINDLVNAVNEISAAIAQYQGSAPSASRDMATLKHMQAVIQNWRH